MKKSSLLSIFLLFAKISLTTFGGGLAMLPILEREVVHKRGWATLDEMHDYYAISQITPGIIAVNTATFLGRRRRGAIGGIVATLGVCFPTLVTIVLLALILSQFMGNAVVQSAFAGIRVAVVVLIGKSALPLLKRSIIDVLAFVVFAVVLILSLALDLTPVIYVLCAATVGILTGIIKRRRVKS